ERIRETTEYSSVLFYIEIHRHNAKAGTVFSSSNLHGYSIPDVQGKKTYNAKGTPLGELRVGEFLLGPMDVVIATTREPMNRVLQTYVEVCLILLGVAILATAAIGLGLSRLALKPVRLIRSTAARISSDNLGERIPVANVRDEITDLAQLLNRTFDRLEASFKQVRQFSADASHEIKTPLSLIRIHAEELLDEGSLTARQKEKLEQQLEEIEHMNKVIEDLLLLSRAEAQGVPLDLALHETNEFVAAFCQDAQVLAEGRG